MTIAHAAAWLLLAGQITPDDLDRGTQPGELQTEIAPNTVCNTCHRSTTEPRMAVNTYKATLMDLAGVDPIFLASLEIAYNDFQPAAELCIRCHFPRGWLEGRGNGPPEEMFGLEENDLQGVNCDFCHRMQVPPPIAGYQGVAPPPHLSGVLISNSQAYVNDGNLKFGPLGSDVVVGHNSQYSPLFDDSVICAQCHDVSNTFVERLDLDGVTGLDMAVPIERTYTEWASSDYGDPASPDYKGCTDCHMDRWDGKAATPGNAMPREGLNTHDLVGGNVVSSKMVAYLNDGPDAPAYLQNLQADAERIAARAEENLKKAAELEAMTLEVRENGNFLRVRVTNKTGHKLPTGYAEGRRMFIGHDVKWANNTQGPRTGTPHPTTWEFLPAEDPVRKWEILLANDDGHSFHFVAVDRIAKDNRIPPQGFLPRADTPVVSHEYTQNLDGTLVNYDEVDLPLGTATTCWPAVTTVKLYFQGTSGDYWRFLVENSPTFGPDLEESWLAVGGFNPVVMEELSVAVFPDGTIEPAAGPYECQPGPVFETPEPDPEPAPQPDVVEPDPEPGTLPGTAGPCACAGAPPSFPAVAAFLGVVPVWLIVRRRRGR